MPNLPTAFDQTLVTPAGIWYSWLQMGRWVWREAAKPNEEVGLFPKDERAVDIGDISGTVTLDLDLYLARTFTAHLTGDVTLQVGSIWWGIFVFKWFENGHTLDFHPSIIEYLLQVDAAEDGSKMALLIRSR